MKVIQIDSAEHWHSIRAQHIGGSEIAALFDMSPYVTRYMLHHAKAGTAPLPEPDHNRVEWGKLLEPVIAQGVAAEMRWRLEEQKVYCEADDCPRMGATIDRFIIDNERGPGVVQLKNIDWLQWKRTWTETHAAPHVELQLQHELGVTDFSWGAIVALVGGNQLVILEREPHRPTIKRIKEAITDFWRAIERREPPDPFGAPVELETLRALCTPADPKELADLTGDAEAFEAARMLQWASEQQSSAYRTREAAKIKLLHRIGTAQIIKLPGFDIRRSKSGSIHRCEMLPGAQAPAAGDAHPFL